jgi:DNA ligase-associated metallophosphoesterase
LALAIAGERVTARPSGALWIEAAGALVVADLHFEKGSSFAARGQLLPPYDTGETLARLEAEVADLAPRLIVFLGDTLHDGGAEARLAEADRGRIAALARGRELVWIAGNHDPAGPRNLPGECVDALAVGSVRLVHEPAARPALGEIAGHLHPCALVPGVGRRRRCFVADGERLILPAFGAYAGGLNVRDPAIRGLLGPKKFAAVLGVGRVHPIPWRTLRGD